MSEANVALPDREDVPEKYRWKLEHIYASEEAWHADFKEVKRFLPDIKQYEGKLNEGADVLLAALKLRDEVNLKTGLLFAYAKMRKDENTANPRYQALEDKAKSLIIDVREATSYFVPELLAIPAERIRQLIEEKTELAIYRHYLENIIRQKAHVLSPPEEQLLARAGEIAQAPSAIFGMINDADIEFPSITDEQGREVVLTKGRYRQFIESPDRRVRREAFQAMHQTYKKQENTLAATLQASIKKDVFYARVRKYDSAREAALDADNIPLAVYDNLLKSVHDHLHLLHRYVTLRKKILALDEIHMYDLYTPLVPHMNVKVTYEEAQETIKTALKPLGEEYLANLQKGFTSGWIDVMENKGKRSGAYSFGPYGTHPFVLLNHHDTLDHMFTLAHEMGHAMHSYYSNTHQPQINANYTIFVAEVASTLNEALLMHHLLKGAKSEQGKRYLLNHYMEQFRTTLFRQTLFAEFEMLTHQMVEEGEALTPERLSQVYRDLNVKYYGTDIVIDAEADIEWARIPHFYYNFYVYKYATGFSAATALAKRILQEGRPAVDRYLNFLKSGSSDYSINLLQKAGVDMTTPEPVNDALNVFKQLLEQMEDLT